MRCVVGLLQGSILTVSWRGEKSSRLLLILGLLLCLSLAEVIGSCATAQDCYPGISSRLVMCDTGLNGRNVCTCSDCFELSPVTELCELQDGCWKIASDRCIDRNDQQQHFPLIIALYITASLSIVLLLLVVILMKCAMHKPERRDFFNSRRKMDGTVAVLFFTVIIATFVFIGSIAGSLALLFSTDFEVPEFFERCIGGL